MFEHPVDVRWRDVDALGHVNHAVFLTYLEEGRDAFFAQTLASDPIYVVVRLEVLFDSKFLDKLYERCLGHVAVRHATQTGIFFDKLYQCLALNPPVGVTDIFENTIEGERLNGPFRFNRDLRNLWLALSHPSPHRRARLLTHPNHVLLCGCS